MSSRYAVGIVHYHAYPDLDACLESLSRQRLLPERVVIVDVDPDPLARAALPDRPSLVWLDAANRGFAGGANLALGVLREETGAEYLLVLNPDTVLEPGFAEGLVEAMDARPRVAIATGKLLRRDGRIDSAGIRLPRHRRPRDRGSEERDDGRYEQPELVFAASGAAMMIRRAALAELAIEGEVFDEDFFMYHEDTDLCWRAGLLGWQVLYVPTARAVHDRTWVRARRFEMPAGIRRHSFKNHYLQLIKNESPGGFAVNLPILASWEVLRLGFALLRDRELLAGYADAWRLSRRAWHKRRVIRSARARSLAEISA